MTIGPFELGLYCLALGVLVITPGPVVMAIVARSLASGARAAVPLAAGVVVGDALWPLLAVFGLAALAELYGEAMVVLRYFGAAILIWMGWRLLARGGGTGEAPAALAAPSGWAGFLAGVMVNLGNPKSILFFVGALPSFFDLARLTGADIAAILAVSVTTPLLGNLAWAALAGRARSALASAPAMRRVNRICGGVLTGAGVAIATR